MYTCEHPSAASGDSLVPKTQHNHQGRACTSIALREQRFGKTNYTPRENPPLEHLMGSSTQPCFTHPASLYEILVHSLFWWTTGMYGDGKLTVVEHAARALWILTVDTQEKIPPPPVPPHALSCSPWIDLQCLLQDVGLHSCRPLVRHTQIFSFTSTWMPPLLYLRTPPVLHWVHLFTLRCHGVSGHVIWCHECSCQCTASTLPLREFLRGRSPLPVLVESTEVSKITAGCDSHETKALILDVGGGRTLQSNKIAAQFARTRTRRIRQQTFVL